MIIVGVCAGKPGPLKPTKSSSSPIMFYIRKHLESCSTSWHRKMVVRDSAFPISILFFSCYQVAGLSARIRVSSRAISVT